MERSCAGRLAEGVLTVVELRIGTRPPEAFHALEGSWTATLPEWKCEFDNFPVPE
jgi:hypothetical protein